MSTPMALYSDKGPIPLDKPDAKVVTALNPETNELWAVAIDLSKKQYACWNQARGWVVRRFYYGPYDLTSWQAIWHDYRLKLVASTFAQTSADGQSHLVTFALSTGD